MTKEELLAKQGREVAEQVNLMRGFVRTKQIQKAWKARLKLSRLESKL